MRGSFLLSLAVIGLPISACTKPDVAPPAVEIRTVTVDRPVPVTCVKKEDIPAAPAKIGDKLTGDARRDLDLVSASAIRLRAYAGELRAMLIGCAKP